MVDAYLYNFESKVIVKIENKNEATMDQIAVSLPPGVYSTIRTYEKKYALHLKLHLERLIEGFDLSDRVFPFEINDLRSQINSILDRMCCDIRFRIHIPFETPQLCYILVEDLPIFPISFYTHGVSVKTNKLERNNPKAKLTDFIRLSIEEKERIKKEKLEESIILDKDGNLLEGLSSNFFSVIGGTIYTADEGVLHGITRKIVIEEIIKSGIKIIYKPLNISESSNIDEAFISSTSRNVMPVVKIDHFIIGTGVPGAITKEIMDLLAKRLKRETETILI